MLFFTHTTPPHAASWGVWGCGRLIIVLNWSSLGNSEQSECRNSKFPPLKSLVVGWGGVVVVVVVVVCLIIVSTPGPDFVKVKARFGQVGD